MFVYPDIDPIALRLGPLTVHWYGLMYLLGFGLAWLLASYRARRPNSGWTSQQVNDLIFYSAIGVLVGGRLGYMLFYDFHVALSDPLQILKIWTGGMSFHGGLIGVLIAVWCFSKRYQKPYFAVGDFLAPLVPIGLGAGRIGNFINGELLGRITDVPWAIQYPHLDAQPRHPSSLYEFLLEGALLFLILWIYSGRPRPVRSVSGLFLIGYGVFRCLAECFRAPDPQLGFLAFGWLTMGQLLSIPMILFGLFLMCSADRSALPSSVTAR